MAICIKCQKVVIKFPKGYFWCIDCMRKYGNLKDIEKIEKEYEKDLQTKQKQYVMPII